MNGRWSRKMKYLDVGPPDVNMPRHSNRGNNWL